MNLVRNIPSYVIWLLLLTSTVGFGQSNLDSLVGVYEDNSKPDTARMLALHDLAWEGYLYSNPDTAFTIATTLTEYAKKVNDLKWEALGENIKGVTYYVRGDYQEAASYFEISIDLKNQYGDSIGVAASLSNLGVIYEVMGDVDKAHENYTKSLKMYESINDLKGMSAGYHNLAIVYEIKGEIEKSIKSYHKALEINEQRGDEHAISVSYNNLGSIYHQQGDQESAEKYYRLSLELKSKLNEQNGMAVTMSHLGGLMADQGKIKEALEFQKNALDIRLEIDDKSGVANSHLHLGKLFKIQERNEEALRSFQLSSKLFTELGDKFGMVNSLNALGGMYLVVEEDEKAEECGEKSYQLALELASPASIMDAAQLRSESKERTGDFQKGLEMYKLFIRMRDSINNAETHEVAMKEQLKYEYEKEQAVRDAESEKNMELAEEREAYQKNISYVVGALLVLVAVFLIFAVNRLKLTKKQRDKIAEQRDEVNEARIRANELFLKEELARTQIEVLHGELTDSIRYAASIQKSILTSPEYWKQMFSEYLVYFRPKDIVSGDFYWAYERNDGIKIWVVADCTGHGVPGGFMSMLGNALLNEIVVENGVYQADEIVNQLRTHVIKTLNKQDNEGPMKFIKDGMDLSLCVLHPSGQFDFVGANNPVWILNRNESSDADKVNQMSNGWVLNEFKPDKQPVGMHYRMEPFTLRSTMLKANDLIYTFSDGFSDQFGGDRNKKYMHKRFKNFLGQIASSNLSDQQELFESEFNRWRGGNEQIDDICVVGVKYSG